MVKLSQWRDPTGKILPAQWEYCVAAASAASALIANAAARQQQQQPDGAVAARGATCCNSSPALAVAALPFVLILGRCCMLMDAQLHTAKIPEQQQVHRSAEQQPQEQQPAQEQQQQELTRPKVYQFDSDWVHGDVSRWLVAGNAYNQLVGAGYSALLETLCARLEDMEDLSSRSLPVIVQQLQSTGLPGPVFLRCALHVQQP
jgi:hypothetical protein